MYCIDDQRERRGGQVPRGGRPGARKVLEQGILGVKV